MINWIMNKIGFISIDEAEKYDFTLIYKIDNKAYNKKIVDYFNNDGLVFTSRQEGVFMLDNISTKDLKILKYNGQIEYIAKDAKLKMEHIDKLELMADLYADIVENRQRVDNDLFEDVITKFKMATFYNSNRSTKDIDSVIDFMKNDVWINLYGKAYDEF